MEEEAEFHIPPRPHQILGLDFTCAHIAILRALLDVLHQLLLLVFQLHAFPVQLPLCLFERALVFAEAFCGCHTFAERPFYYLDFVNFGAGSKEC